MRNNALEMGLEKLLTYLDDPDRNQAELEAGLAYLRQSPGYEERVENFVQAIIAPEPASEEAPFLAELPERAGNFLVSWQKSVEGLMMELAYNFGPSRQLQPRVNMLKGTKSMVWEVSVPEAIAKDEESHLRLEIQEKPGDPTHCTIMVDVQLPGRGPADQAGTAVILKRNEEELAAQMTDRFGKVFYQDIVTDMLTDLMLEITLLGPER